jgi:hypothetical protein
MQTKLEISVVRKNTNLFQICCIAKILSVGQFELIKNGLKFSCTHPFTNEGEIDYDYMITSVSNFEVLDIWIFRGTFNFKEISDRLNDFPIEIDRLPRLVRIYWAVLFRVSWMRIFSKT